MRGQGLNDLPRCEPERRSSHHKGIFFEVPIRLYHIAITLNFIERNLIARSIIEFCCARTFVRGRCLGVVQSAAGLRDRR